VTRPCGPRAVDLVTVGSAVDVFDPEPPGNQLFGLPNSVVTPHIAGLAGPGLAELSQAAAIELPRALRGQRPIHVLNPSAWPPLPQWD
jgi:D-3-phosphoglycerate dehydrogenase / 2-oxoglutarate reductase